MHQVSESANQKTLGHKPGTIQIWAPSGWTQIVSRCVRGVESYQPMLEASVTLVSTKSTLLISYYSTLSKTDHRSTLVSVCTHERISNLSCGWYLAKRHLMQKNCVRCNLSIINPKSADSVSSFNNNWQSFRYQTYLTFPLWIQISF